MPRQSKPIFFALVSLTLLLSASLTPAAAAPLEVFVSILPQKTIVQKIGGELVHVSVMVPPGAGPATYEPKPSQMARLSRSAIYFSVGVPFEQAWLPKFAAANPGMRIVPTDHGIEKRAMAEHHHDAERQTHDDAEYHDHDGDDTPAEHVLDPHVWLAPALIKVMAENIFNALDERLPGHGELLRQNLTAFKSDVDDADEEASALLAPLKGRRFMVFHPSWGYFAQAYGLIQIPVEIEGKAPKPAQLERLIREAREQAVKVIFVQPQFSTRTARIIADSIGGRVITADPLAADLLENLVRQARAIEEALR